MGGRGDTMKLLKSFLERFNNSKKVQATPELPTYLGQLSIYRDRQRVSNWVLGSVVTLCLAIVVLQEVRSQRLTTALSEKDYLIVPGAPEFMRIRPGLIAPESVYLFSEYAASQLSTFSYNTVEGQFKSIADLMTPELKTRFLLSVERPIKMYKDLRVDQVFDIEPVKTFELKNDARGPKYVVRVRGQTRKYVEGALRESVPTEVVSFVFRPRKIKTNQPWFFEIESFSRLTPDEEEKMKALDSLNQLENN